MHNLKKARLNSGLKQRELAERVGLSIPSISYYENGIKKPSMNSAFKIAQVLDVTIDELFYSDTYEKQEV